MNVNFIFTKKYLILFFIICIFHFAMSYGQYNLVNNSGFEEGTYTCFMCYGTNCNINSINNWSYAPHENDEGAGDSPIWANPNSSSCNSYELYNYTGCSCIHGYTNGIGMHTGSFPPINPQTKFVVISQYGVGAYNFFGQWKPPYDIIDDKYRKSHHNAIITQLIHPLEEGKSYYIKMKYVAYTSFVLEGASGRNHLRVFFTKNQSNCLENNNNNQIFEAIYANIQEEAIFYNCKWSQLDRMFTVPTGAGLNQLNNLVLYVEEGSFGIDDIEIIEIYEKCTDNLFIENKIYDDYFYNPLIQGQNFIYQANNILKAGFDVSSPPYGTGDVIVQNGANITYTAGQKINLLPGFTADKGSVFTAVLEPCYTKSLSKDSNSEKIFSYDDPVVINNLHNINDFFINIYPNPFTSSTEIVYNLPEATDINIYLTNFYSIKVMQVYDSYIAKGMHTISINGTMLQQGVYFCIMETSTQRKVVKVVKM